MQFRVLGPLAVVRDGAEIPLGSRQQRTVLALLLVAAERAVNDDVLVDALWGDAPPPSAQNNLQALVSRLRRVLGSNTIERRGEGYALVLAGVTLDSQVFAARAEEGRRLLGRGEAAAAEGALSAALGLFRGEPYADFRYDDFAAGEIARLEQLRLAASEDRIEALLALGRDRDVVSEVEALVAAHPYHERFWHQLVLALFRLGRQADALAAHRRARHALVHDLGVEPSTEFRELERRILLQDRTLLGAPAGEDGHGRPKRVPAAIAAVCAAAVVVAVVIAVTRDPAHGPAIGANSLVSLDVQTGRPLSSTRLPFAPRAVAAAGGSVWVGALRTNAVARVVPASRRLAQSIGLPGASSAALVADTHGAWVASATSRTAFALERVVPGHDEPTNTLRWDTRTYFSVGEQGASLAVGGRALWASNRESSVDVFDPVSGTRVAHVVPDDGVGPIAWGGGALWSAYTLSDTLTRIDGRTHAVSWTIPLAQSSERSPPRLGTARRGEVDPSAVAYGFGSVWVAGYGIDSVIRIDPVRRVVLATIPVGHGPTAVAVGGGAVWVANRLGRSVSRIDPRLNGVTATTDLGFRAESLAVAAGRVWVAVQGR